MEETVHSCNPCQALNPKHTHREPIRTTPLTATPWTEISVDFAVPFLSGEYLLVVIDDYSRLSEIEIFPSLSAIVVIPRFNMIFAQQRYPTIVKTDNGPPTLPPNQVLGTEGLHLFGLKQMKEPNALYVP